MNLTRITYKIRSRIRLARYASRYPFAINGVSHPVTLGPEQLSRFFAFVANSERRA
ncbi:hypothetical protein [Porticoccus sp.]